MPLFQGWRVEDASSRAKLKDQGIVSGSSDEVNFWLNNAKEVEDLREAMLAHLDWHNTRDTPFISVYKDMDRAEMEATRRMNAGKRNVVIHEILVDDGWRGRVQFRSVPKLMNTLGERIPERAAHMAEYEVVFLHCIPWECVLVTLYPPDGKHPFDQR